ncbi:MAG: phage tail tape measure protein, partial [Rudaea sp.]
MGNTRDETVRLVYETTGSEQLRDIASGLSDIAKGSTDAAPAAQALLDQFAKLATESSAVDNLVALKAQLGEVGINLQTAQKALADLNNEFDRTDTSSAAVNSRFAKAEDAVASLTAKHSSLATQVALTTTTLENAGVDTTKLGDAHAALAGKLEATGTQAVALTSTFNQHAAAADKAGESTKGAGDKATVSAAAFTFLKDHLIEVISVATAVEIALKGIDIAKNFGGDSLKAVEDVQASLSRVQAAAKGTQDQFAQLDTVVDEAAKAVNVSAETAATGIAALTSHGLDLGRSFEALIPTLQLAKIAQIDVGTAAQTVAQILLAFNIPASESQKVVDELTTASHGAAGGLAAMSTAATTLAPDARQLGLSFDQTVSILGLLATKGFDTEKALRGLRTVFQELQDPTSKLRGDLLALGDGTNDFGKAVAALTSGSARANEALLDLKGPARTVIEAFGQDGPDALAKFQQHLQDSGGSAKNFSDVLDNNTKGAVTRFQLAFSKAGEELAKPILKPLQDELVILAKKLDDLVASDEFKKIEAQVGQFVVNASDALNKFIDQIDWSKLGKNAEDGLKHAVDSAKSLADSAQTIANAVVKTADVVGAVWKTAAAGVDVAASVVSEASGLAVDGLGRVVTVGEKLAGTSGDAGKSISEFGDVLENVSDTNMRDAAKNIAGVGDNLADLAGHS